MKEIIEKYKKGELVLDEFLKLGLKLETGDVCRNDAQFTVQAFALSSWNKPEERDNEYKIVNSVQLDKEIAAMEKQYKYEKVTESINEVAKLMIDGEVFWSKGGEFRFAWDGGKFVNNRSDEIAMAGDFYRRIPLTQEELEAQKVDELAEFMREGNSRRTLDLCDWGDVGDLVKDEYRRYARRALEWMKQEG